MSDISTAEDARSRILEILDTKLTPKQMRELTQVLHKLSKAAYRRGYERGSIIEEFWGKTP